MALFDRSAASVGPPGLTPHQLRHTAANFAVSAGANVKAVQRMLGHASAALTLDVYAGLSGNAVAAEDLLRPVINEACAASPAHSR